MNRDLVPYYVSRILGWRPVRWASLAGDYEGCERTLHVFNADLSQQRQLLVEIDRRRRALEDAAGGPLVVIFHSVRQTAERYREFAEAFPKPLRDVAQAFVLPPERCVDVQDDNGHIGERRRCISPRSVSEVARVMKASTCSCICMT